jgi:flagellar basal-body rod modification protein FlgD
MSPTGISSTAASGGVSGVPTKFELKGEDFIKMMITQLQNQDPLEPAKNEQLLSQMSQIGQLESSTQLQSSLETMVLQNNLAASGNLIGKQVEGFADLAGETIEVDGQVSSVAVEGKDVWLELDTGHRVRLDRVTSVAG